MNIKLQLYIGAILIAVVRIFLVEAQAHTSHCPPPQTCPPVLACPEGYSCQPDEPLLPQSGEKQKYPPVPGEVWVNTIVSTNTLTDVAVNDLRWRGRDKGEVYARENKDFIVWYWPSGGDAVFDTTSLGNQHLWHDFTYSTGISGSGGPMTSDVNMRIKFSNGQGISIFKRADETHSTTPPNGDGFLAFYTNPEREKLPANRIYPLGQKMMLTAWNPKNVSQVNDLHAHGFTAIGPWENAWPSSNKKLRDMVSRAKELGMRTWLFLHNKYGMVYKACNAFAAGKTIEEMVNPMTNLYKEHYGKEPYDSTADAYILLPEELSSRLDRCSESRLLAYNDALIDRIRELDKQIPPRPIIRTEVEGNKSSNIQTSNKRIGAPAAQHYFEHWGQSGKYNHMAIIQVKNRGYLSYFKDLDKNHLIDEVRVPAILPGMIYEPKDKSLGGARKYANYYIWTSLIQGFKSFSIYKMDKHVANGNLKQAYKEVVKKMTDYGFDQAFLWGNSTPDMSLIITRSSGSANANWSQGIRGYKAESMLAAERQFGDKRYIAITNSHWNQGISVTFSGLPVGSYNLRNCKTDKVEKITSSSKTVTVEPNGYAIYRVEKRT
jgi:hypothetical protein